MANLVINVNLDRRCEKCRKPGAVNESGLCCECLTKRFLARRKQGDKARPKYVYEKLEGKTVVGKIALLNPPPAPGSDFDLKIGEVGPYSSRASVRRVK